MPSKRCYELDVESITSSRTGKDVRIRDFVGTSKRTRIPRSNYYCLHATTSFEGRSLFFVLVLASLNFITTDNLRRVQSDNMGAASPTTDWHSSPLSVVRSSPAGIVSHQVLIDDIHRNIKKSTSIDSKAPNKALSNTWYAGQFIPKVHSDRLNTKRKLTATKLTNKVVSSENEKEDRGVRNRLPSSTY